MAFTKYDVKVTFQYPAWDEVDGMTVTVFARSKREATARARREMQDAGHQHLTFRAVEADKVRA